MTVDKFKSGTAKKQKIKFDRKINIGENFVQILFRKRDFRGN